MRKIRADAKPINLHLALNLHGAGVSLRQVSRIFMVDHSNLLMRFKRFGFPLQPKKRKRTPQSLREKASKSLGRPLKQDEVTHHLSYKPECFIICSKKYHSWIHAKMQNGLIGKNYNR
ncbi:MAG: hypothetical protein ABIJ26_00280 [Candidatus Margulisiibacteriota bacterium]